MYTYVYKILDTHIDAINSVYYYYNLFLFSVFG